MRILFTSTAGLGHVHPLFPLMHAARAAGDEVLVAIPGDGEAAVRNLGFDTVVTTEPSPEESAAFWAGVTDHPEPNTAVIGDWFGRLRVNAGLGTLREIVATFEPDMLVSEAAEFAGPLAAEAAGIAHVTVGVAAMDMAGFTAQPLIDNMNTFRMTLGLDATDEVPWRHRTRFVTAVPSLLWSSPSGVPDGTVFYRQQDAESARPTEPARLRPATSPRRVYASLGTVAGGFEFAARLYAPVLAALGQVDADVLFIIGSLDPAMLGPIPPNVKVERYMPNEVAMACDAVVTHAGCGTTVAALSRGLPMVAVPLFGDQPHNAQKIAESGAGISLEVPHGIGDLPAAVAAVLDDPAYAATARRIAADLAKLPSAADVLAQLRPVTVH
jgi:UDP:flavonoid glycosyltransferase YjiC (YdhE family)